MYGKRGKGVFKAVQNVLLGQYDGSVVKMALCMLQGHIM